MTNSQWTADHLTTFDCKSKLIQFLTVTFVQTFSGKTYSFRYFRTYKFDWRLLLNHPNGEPVECKCSRGRLHSQQCPWYHPYVINTLDIRNDLSTSEQATQGKIYTMYQNTLNGLQELCGCGTAAEITYLGHKSTCNEFQWIHERSSWDAIGHFKEKKERKFLWTHQPQKQEA